MKGVIKFSGYTHRFLARFVIEAETPLVVSSGEKDVLTDALVATDVNGLPYIPGTAIAGVVRHMLEDVSNQEADEYGRSLIEKLFGYQETKKQKEAREKAQKAKNEKVEDLSKGSEIIFTEAKILNSEGKVIDGMNLDVRTKDPLLQNYNKLPIRQHVRINDKGVTDKTGKFDEQVVFAGTRFCFELEMVAKDDVIDSFNKVIEQVQSRTFRIGGGTRSGFGKIKVKDLQTKPLDLTKQEQLKAYLEKSSSLNSDFWDSKYHEPESNNKYDGWVKYELKLRPEDFFLFGSGFGDEDVDMTPVKEKKVVWENDVNGRLSEDLVLIPAASVKGALAHRVAFHYNKTNHVYAENFTTDEEREKVVGKNNEAVKALFGSEGEKDADNKMINQQRGNLLFSDVIKDELTDESDKILNHVAIDRFTGGAIDGALFSEKTTYGKGQEFILTILVKESALKGEKVKDSLEAAMIDICKGLLPLGGGVNRGNGTFSGSLFENNVEVYPEDKRKEEQK